MKSLLNGKAVCSLPWVLCLCAILTAVPARAQTTISTVTPLDFGVIVLRDWSSVGRVTINSGGSFTYNSNVYLHEDPERGEYRIEGGPINTIYTVTLPPSVTLAGPGGNFTLDNFGVEPAVLITDGSGEDTFYIIGRLQSQGGGISYGDGTYNTTFIVTINF